VAGVETEGDDVGGALAGMAALVTGGGGGIGSASALELARDGAAVTLMGRTEATLQGATERLLGELPPGSIVQYVVGDGTIAADVEHAVDLAHRTADGLRICVATVGGGPGTIAPMLLLDDDTLLRVYTQNVVSAFLAMKHSTPRMAERGGGSVVCVSSVAARATSPYLSNYVAAKAALEALVRAAAVELAAFGIRVNAVRPGSILTKPRSDAELARGEAASQRLPIHRIGIPVDVAAGVRYLAGPESSYVTGQSFAIDGGSEVVPTAPTFDGMLRERFGDQVIDEALAGRIPRPDRALP
jgi:NAD(P)-dependent dehydrogenase (short-subunit alcohol dehydrogenase family)